VDEALCFGWIDGIRRRVDADRYTIRFTPRRAGSIWSLVNTKRVAELKADPAAWKFFKSRPPGYQRLTSWWVISASKEETRLKRLGTLIACCAAGRTIGRLTPK
jgi:uncharacterized protein YdeI (YjbR/CyaY-like superfamily)